MKLILTRHGETTDNKKKLLQGHLPGKLTKLGIEQAKKLALRLKDEKIDVIYSSDLKRAVDTTKEIIKYHKEVPVYYIEELRERNLGSYQGKNPKNLDWINVPEDVESLEAMQARTKKLLDDVYKKHPKETVLFVAHGGISRSLLTVVLNKSADIFSLKKPGNTAVYIIEFEENSKGKIIIENCTKHL